MEKVKIKTPRGKCIVGNMISNKSDTIVVLAHGFTNDKSSNGRFDRTTKALNSDGLDTLAIDFSGSGESDDDALTLENQYEDLSSVIEYLLNKSYEKIILFANSFASISCLKNYRPEILTMILTGAVTDSVKYKWHEFFSLDQLEDLNKNGYFKMKNKREHLIVKQTLKDFEEIDQVKLLKNVKCPVLIIHGNNKDDLEEIELLSHSRRAIKKLPEASELEVIEGGRHGLHDHWDQVIEMTLQWTRKYKE